MHADMKIHAVAPFEPVREIKALLAERALIEERLDTWRDLMTAADDGMDGNINFNPELLVARLETVESRIMTLRRHVH